MPLLANSGSQTHDILLRTGKLRYCHMVSSYALAHCCIVLSACYRSQTLSSEMRTGRVRVGGQRGSAPGVGVWREVACAEAGTLSRQLWSIPTRCVVLCYAMLCWAGLCCVVLCYARKCYAVLSYAMRCYATLCYVPSELRYRVYSTDVVRRRWFSTCALQALRSADVSQAVWF